MPTITSEQVPRPAVLRRDATIPARADRSHRVRKNWLRQASPLIWVCFGVLAAFVLCGVFAGWLAPHDPTAQSLRARLQPPLGFGGTTEYPLGTDALGRDVLSRLIFGARVSLAIGFAGMLIGLTLGTACGLVAGFARGLADDAVMFLVDVKLALPYLIIMLTLVSLLGRSLTVLVIVAGFSGWGAYTRMARGMALRAREEQYMVAARALGAGNVRLIFRHILPNALAPMVVLATLNLTEVIFLESSLSFLGAGVRPPTPSWGSMLAEGRDYLHTAWWAGVLPGVAIVLVTMSISLTGDWLRDRLDPTLRGRSSAGG